MKIFNLEQDFLHIRESYQHLGEYSLAAVQFHRSQKDENVQNYNFGFVWV